MELAGLGEVQASKQMHLTAGEMISQVGLYTQENADRIKAQGGYNLQRFFSTPEEEAQLIEISEQYLEYLKKVRATLDQLINDPLYQVAFGAAGTRGRASDRSIGGTLEMAYNLANDLT